MLNPVRPGLVVAARSTGPRSAISGLCQEQAAIPVLASCRTDVSLLTRSSSFNVCSTRRKKGMQPAPAQPENGRTSPVNAAQLIPPDGV